MGSSKYLILLSRHAAKASKCCCRFPSKALKSLPGLLQSMQWWVSLQRFISLSSLLHIVTRQRCWLQTKFVYGSGKFAEFFWSVLEAGYDLFPNRCCQWASFPLVTPESIHSSSWNARGICGASQALLMNGRKGDKQVQAVSWVSLLLFTGSDMGCNMRIILADLSLSFNLFGCSIEAKAAWTKSFPTVIFDSPSCLAALRRKTGWKRAFRHINWQAKQRMQRIST